MKQNFTHSINSFISFTGKTLLLAWGIFSLACAQNVPDSTTSDTTRKQGVYRLQTKDGSVLLGKIVKSGKDYLIFETKDLGQVNVPLNKIKNLALFSGKEAKKIIDKAQWYDNRMNNQKHFISTSGFNLRKNDFYLEDTYVFLVSMRYGITDNISIGAGASFLPGLTLQDQIYFINPKITFDLGKKLNFGASFNWMNFPEVGNIGFLNLALTYGSPQYNITAGTSYGVIGSEISSQPMINFATFLRPANWLAIIGDFIWVPTRVAVQSADDYTPFITVGFRFINKESSFDLGFLSANNSNPQAQTQLYIPYLSYRHKIW